MLFKRIAVLLVSLVIPASATLAGPIDKQVIAIIDTGVDLNNIEVKAAMCGGEDFTGQGLQDADGHGTNMFLTISRQVNLSKFCLMPLKWYHTKEHRNWLDTPVPLTYIVSAINRAIRVKAKIINMSLNGSRSFEPERQALKRALDLGLTVVVAAGNSGKDLSSKCSSYPACYAFKSKNFYVVAGVDENGMVSKNSNYGGPVNAVEAYGNDLTAGTSVSAAIHTAKVAMACSKNSCYLRR